MSSLAARVLAALAHRLDAPRWHLGFSGGLDSTVLLHLLVSLRKQRALPMLTAVHVQHGLQPAAQAWPAHCQAMCQAWQIPLQVVSVQVNRVGNLEAAARAARYGAFQTIVHPDELLLTAQHADDQAETLLFRLLRGAGVKGLAGMPSERVFGSGWLVRPLLEVRRQELVDYANAAGLRWIEDPSNSDLSFSRNYLRQQVMPALQARWPQMQANFCRAAEHMQDSQQLLDELAQLDLQTVCDAPQFAWLGLPELNLMALRGLTASRQRNLLRYWLADFTQAPDTRHWLGWEQLRDAASDAEPRWQLAQGELRRAGQRLYFLPAGWVQSFQPQVLSWSRSERLDLPGNGWVRLMSGAQTARLSIRYRQGGERLYIPKRGQRDLKRLLNEVGIPAFVRNRLPLLYVNDQLVAVANIFHYSVQGYALSWEPPRLS